MGTLLRDLADDVAVLVRKEMALARAEVSDAVSEARQGISGLATGGGILYAGFLFLLLSAFIGLTELVAGWLAALLVGAVTALVGLIVMKSGQSKLQPGAFRPDRTQESLRKDAEMLHRRSS